MRRIYYLLSLVSLGVLLTGTGLSQESVIPTGLWVAEKVDKREIGKDASLKMEMTLIDKKGRERKRRLFILRKDFNGKDKLLLKFTYPHDIKGTSFLVWEHKGRDNEMFLYLPALGRVRRIASSEREENFAGTDFSYEDIAGRKLEDYTYELVKEEIVYKGRKCYLLASYPVEKNPIYPKILSWVDKESFVIIRAEYINRRGETEKIFEVMELKEIDNIWTQLELSMENLKTKHKTIIKVKEVQYNKGIPDERFTKSEMTK